MAGWNLDALGLKSQSPFVIAAKKILDDPRVENRLRARLGDRAEQIEQEPNNKSEDAQLISVPGAVNGCLQSAGDEDRFAFTTKKDERYEFRLAGGSLGFPTSAVLRVEDQSGKQLARDEISVTLEEPKIAWTAPSDGKFILAVSDLYRHGGEDYFYRLEAGPQIADFGGKTDNQRYRLDPGKTTDIKVSVTRINRHKGKVMVSAKGLPEGVTAKEVEAGSGATGEVKLTLTATPDAKPSSQPLQILLTAPGDKPVTRTASFGFRAKDSKTGDFLVNETDQIWLTVVATNVPAASPEAKKKKK
jgi:hypothetical protein